jgi:hypothetical protein
MGRLFLYAAAVFLIVPAAFASERLQVPQLTGWKTVSSISDNAGQSTELIPASETPDNWTRRVTVQAFRGVSMTVGDFLSQSADKTAAVCEAASAGRPSLGMVSGGAPAGSRTVACGRYKGDGRGTYMLYFVVRGREAFYVVSRYWRGAPFDLGQNPVPPDEMRDWISFADKVDICDTADPARPCRD